MNRFATIALTVAAAATASAQTHFNLGVVTEGFAFNVGNTPAYPVIVAPAVAPAPAIIPMMPGYVPVSHHAAKHLRKAAKHYRKARRHYMEAARPGYAPGASLATPFGTIYVGGAPSHGYYYDDDDDDYEDYYKDYYKHMRKHYKKHKKHHHKHHHHHDD